MSSYVLSSLTTSYAEVLDLKETPHLSRRGLAVQNQFQTIVWIRVGEDGQREFAFLPNVAILLDFSSDLLTGKLYAKAEAVVSGRKAILTVW
jgi:hypothetical protein